MAGTRRPPAALRAQMASSPAVEEDEEEEEVPPEFECTICMKLLLEPVSIPCGHTFCCACIEQSLGYRSLCAVCRAPVAGGQSVNILIRGIIAERYPVALAKRCRELEEELCAVEREAEEVRRRDAAGGSVTTEPLATAATAAGGGAGGGAAAGGAAAPVLPLLRSPHVLLLPYCRTDLTLRSQGEVRLLEYALQGGRRIGAIDGTTQPPSGGGGGVGGYDDAARPLGICLEIENVERRAQGPPTARVVGKFRFWLTEAPQVHEDGFELGRCEAFFDTPLPMSDLAPMPEDDGDQQQQQQPPQPQAPPLVEVARYTLELLERQLVNIGHFGRNAFAARFGDAPALRVSGSGVTTSAAMEQLSFFLLGALVNDDAHRRRWLASVDTRGRLEACQRKLETAGSRPALDLPGARSWMNPSQSSLGSLGLLIVIIALLVAKALGFFDQPRRVGHRGKGGGLSNDMLAWMQLF